MSVRTLFAALYLLFVLLLASVCIHQAFETVDKPFAGILPFKNGYVGAFTQPSWEGAKYQLKYHQRVFSEVGEPLALGPEMLQKSSNVTARIEGSNELLSLQVQPLPAKDVFLIFAPLMLSGLLFLLMAIVPLFFQPHPQGAVPFFAFSAATGTYLLTAFDFHTTYLFTSLLMVSFALMPATVLQLSFTFPKPTQLLKNRSWLTWAPYFISLFVGIPYVALFSTHPKAWRIFEAILFVYLSLAYIWWVGLMVYRMFYDSEKEVRVQSKIVLVPLLGAFSIILVVGWLVMVFGKPIPLNFIVPFCVLFPAAIVYGMFRGNLFVVDHLESLVKDRTDALQKVQSELIESKKLAAIGLLSAGTAHEIGNALNLISSNLPVLGKYSTQLMNLTRSFKDERTFDEEKRKADFGFIQEDLPGLLKNMQQGADRATRIVQDLKRFAKPPTEEKTDVELVEMMESTLRFVKPELGARIEIEKEMPELVRVQASRGQLQQVMLNLMLNAIQAIEGEGKIQISVVRKKENAVIEIQDSGKGIAAEHLPKLFDPFFTTKADGTGLGLSVSYGIVKSHGGKLEIENLPQQGVRVQVTLPAV